MPNLPPIRNPTFDPERWPAYITITIIFIIVYISVKILKYLASEYRSTSSFADIQEAKRSRKMKEIDSNVIKCSSCGKNSSKSSLRPYCGHCLKPF